MNIIPIIYKILKKEFVKHVNFPIFYVKKTFSQEGEDIIINKIFLNKKTGFYIDIGAFHPYKYSNTYLLYKKGWSGINIEPTSKSIELFKKFRKRDINLNIAVGKNSRMADLIIFNEHALNTLSKKRADIVIKSHQASMEKMQKVKVYTLDHVINTYVKKRKIDLLNIDAEGSEYEILSTFNINKYRPRVIAIENIDKDNKKITRILISAGYRCVAKTSLTEIYEYD